MSMSAGHIESGGLTKGIVWNISADTLWNGSQDGQGNCWKASTPTDISAITKFTYGGVGEPIDAGGWRPGTVKSDEHSCVILNGQNSGDDFWYRQITSDSTGAWKHFTHTDFSGGYHLLSFFCTIFLKEGSEIFAVNSGHGTNQRFEVWRWDYTSPGARTHFEDYGGVDDTVYALGADLTDNYIICAVSDGNIYRLNRSDLSIHDTIPVADPDFLLTQGLCAIDDDTYFVILQSSTHNVVVSQLFSDGTLNQLGSADTNLIIGLQNRLMYALFYVDKLLYWYNADWLGGFATYVRFGPLACPGA